MVKFAVVSLLLQAALVASAPAVVWKRTISRTEVIHSSEHVPAAQFLDQVFSAPHEADASVSGVVFVLERSADGSERLTKMAAEGELPAVAAKYNEANRISHFVGGVESSSALVKQMSTKGESLKVAEVTLDEYETRLSSPTELVEAEEEAVSKKQQRKLQRQQKIAEANLLVVSLPVSVDASKMDAVIAESIDKVDTVVLTGVRSLAEILQERDLEAKRIRQIQAQKGRKIFAQQSRRLDEANDGNDNNADNNGGNGNQDENVYYVAMTPNILAGILFTILFATVTWIGVSCMGAISGQDVYVKKMPSIGREA